MKIIITTKDGIQNQFNNLADIINIKNIISMELNNYNEKKLLIDKNIDVLNINNSSLEEFPIIHNKNIRIIKISTSKISKIPDLSLYENLEELTIRDAYIKTIEYQFPKNLKILNLEYNQIDNTFFNNLLFFQSEIVHINIGHNFITKEPPIDIRYKVDYNNNNIEEKKIYTVMINDIINVQKNKYKNIYETGQTVHISSINSSALKSIKIILDETKKYPINNNYINELFYEFYGSYIYRNIFYCAEMFKINCMVNDKTIHSEMKVSYNKLLERIWVLIMNHVEKKNLILRLKTEIHDSFGYCFTGRINRIINSLCGIVNDIKISISNKEEIQNELNCIIKKYGNKKISKKDALKEMNEILNNSNEDEEYKNSWIEAFNDY